MQTLDRDVARLELFSDAVFAFVATLLVVSLEVPHEFGELADRLAAFPGFAVGFLVLLLFWARHRSFFKRYGHYDLSLVVANGAVLFALLFFVFPLKWIVNIVLARFLRVDLGSAGALHLRTLADLRTLELQFCIGFASVFAGFLLLYLCAWRHRGTLAATPELRARLTFEIRQNLSAVLVSFVSMLLATYDVGLELGLPLWTLLVLVPLRWLHRRLSPAMAH